MTEPLNPLLYRQLQRHFGRVKIHAEGFGFVGRYRPNVLTGREDLLIEQTGEYYAVCCDRCTDTRYRLYVNHRWGVRDERGHRNLWLAYCFNEHCYDSPQPREDLYDRLNEIEGMLGAARVKTGVVDPKARAVDLPGPVMGLHQLPATHPANRYLAGRFYDPEQLGRFYHVGYCAQSFYFLARNRIIIPVYQAGQLKGWQARYIGDLKWKEDPDAPPKYWSCPGMEKGKLLYNFDNAVRCRTGVLVEGPADVWSFGPMAMASFGFPPSAHQVKLVTAAFRKQALVMLFDPDVLDKPATAAKYEQVKSELIKAGFRGGLAAVNLPDGKDPGDFDREFLHEFVAREAKAQGVKVDWRLR